MAVLHEYPLKFGGLVVVKLLALMQPPLESDFGGVGSG
jgi:hypothetical protein